MRQVTLLQVLIDNGEVIGCRAQCDEVFLVMHGYQFNISTYVLGLQVADIILGVQLLMCLGYVTTHYGLLTMQYVVNDVNIILQGDWLLQSKGINNKTLHKLVASEVVTEFYHLRVISEDKGAAKEAVLSGKVQQLLDQFVVVFEGTTKLPPS
ncbi:hypothetical protein S245_012392 [Arachis hypogaea]